MLDNLDHLRQAATWARALTWPVEVSDARLGKTATSFMELATPDAVLALIAGYQQLLLHNTCQGDHIREMSAMREAHGFDSWAAILVENTKLKTENERLLGIRPDVPPRPPEGEGLPRYGLRWNGPQQPLAVPMTDGYWTPWHLADHLKAENETLRAAVEAIAPVPMKTAELAGPALAWAVRQPLSDQPKTFGCHHMMPTCSQCEGLVRSWLAKELGETVEVPTEFARS